MRVGSYRGCYGIKRYSSRPCQGIATFCLRTTGRHHYVMNGGRCCHRRSSSGSTLSSHYCSNEGHGRHGGSAYRQEYGAVGCLMWPLLTSLFVSVQVYVRVSYRIASKRLFPFQYCSKSVLLSFGVVQLLTRLQRHRCLRLYEK